MAITDCTSACGNNDMKHGTKCKEVWPDGTIYEGDYENGLMHGKGLLIYNDTSMYDGDFVRGQMTGKGIFVWPEGKRYEGDWVNNKMQGTGTMKWANGKSTYTFCVVTTLSLNYSF